MTIKNAHEYMQHRSPILDYMIDTQLLELPEMHDAFQNLRNKLKESLGRDIPGDLDKYKFTGNINIANALDTGKLIVFTMGENNSLFRYSNFLYAYALCYIHKAFYMLNNTIDVYIDEIYNSMNAIKFINSKAGFYAGSRKYKLNITTENLSVVSSLYNTATEYGLEVVQL